MKTKQMAMALSLVLSAALTMPAFAADTSVPLLTGETSGQTEGSSYSIQINGQELEECAYVMVPLRAVAEPLGFTVTWQDGSVLVDNGVIHTQVVIGEDRYVITTSNEELVGMSAPFSLGAAPYVIDGVTYVPLGLFDALLRGEDDQISLDGDKIIIQTQDVQLPNPFVECETMAQAEQLAGFSMTLPNMIPNWMDDMEIRAVEDSMIDVVFTGAGNTLSVRKGVGQDDISGDYSSYPETETVDLDGRSVTLKGEEGKVSLAVWSDGEYAYAVRCSYGIERDLFCSMISGVQ